MLRDWKKLVILTAGMGLIGTSTVVKADTLGLNAAGSNPLTIAPLHASRDFRNHQQQRVKVFLNMQGREKFGHLIQQQLIEIAGDRFRFVKNRKRADIVLAVNADLSDIHFNRYDVKNVRDRYKKSFYKNYRKGYGFSWASYEVVKERMTLAYDVNVKVRFEGRKTAKQKLSGRVSQRRKYAQNFKALTPAGWNKNAPAPSKKVARMLESGTAQGLRLEKRQLRQRAARDIARQIATMRLLDGYGFYASGYGYDQNKTHNGRKKRFLSQLISAIAFKSN